MALTADQTDMLLAENRAPGDEKLHARFVVELIETGEAKEGVPVLKEAELLEIHIPGSDDLTVVKREPTEYDKRRFARQYAAFKAGLSDVLDGTPLASAPWVTPSMIAVLARHDVRTVEQLANISDGNLSNIGPILNWRQKARDFLESSKQLHAASQLKETRDELEKLKVQMAEILAAKQAPAAAFEASEPLPKRRGRPPKAESQPQG